MRKAGGGLKFENASRHRNSPYGFRPNYNPMYLLIVQKRPILHFASRKSITKFGQRVIRTWLEVEVRYSFGPYPHNRAVVLVE
jgi:hypothetical protein